MEQVTEWGALSCIAAYDERKRLANQDAAHRYAVEEDHTRTIGLYRVVRYALPVNLGIDTTVRPTHVSQSHHYGDHHMKILFGLFLLFILIVLALAGCTSTEDESQLQQGIGACPWDPPKYCWPVQWRANGMCNDACLQVGGDFAYCPEVSSREEITCCGGATPVTACGACLESIRHTCTGGFEP